jgi:hypothetical protein
MALTPVVHDDLSALPDMNQAELCTLRRLKEVIVRNPWLVAGLCVALLAIAALAYAQGGSNVELQVGDKAPAFSLPGSDGTTYSLEALKGRTVVLAWFPKAFTGG